MASRRSPRQGNRHKKLKKTQKEGNTEPIPIHLESLGMFLAFSCGDRPRARSARPPTPWANRKQSHGLLRKRLPSLGSSPRLNLRRPDPALEARHVRLHAHRSHLLFNGTSPLALGVQGEKPRRGNRVRPPPPAALDHHARRSGARVLQETPTTHRRVFVRKRDLTPSAPSYSPAAITLLANCTTCLARRSSRTAYPEFFDSQLKRTVKPSMLTDK